MSEMWTQFPAPAAFGASDVFVGLAGGTVNARFTAASVLRAAANLADVADAGDSFDNIAPTTTLGDMIYFGVSGNGRLAIGSAGQIMGISAGVPAWINNPALLIASNLSDLNNVGTARTNLGLGTGSSPTFSALTITNAIGAATVVAGTSATAPTFISTGFNQTSVTNAISAFAGGGQGSATALTTYMNRVTTVATAGDSVKLPAAAAGRSVVVINAAASNAMDCFPASGDAINALPADTALSIAANKSVLFNCVVAGIWNSIVTA